MRELWIPIDFKATGSGENIEVLVTSRMVFDELVETFDMFLSEVKVAGNNPHRVEPYPIAIQKEVASAIYESFNLRGYGLTDNQIDDLKYELQHFIRNESVFQVITNPKKYWPATLTPAEMKQKIVFEICKDFEECKFYLIWDQA